ncbi:MAG: hypothetical protein HRT45_04610 [Bdellovibrionales bacterium]|nr:hypothetical protein [Bdellovibrionales bacterium]
MIQKQAHSMKTVIALNNASFVEQAVKVFPEVPGGQSHPASSVDPIGQLKANIKTLHDLTSELSFMVKEIGTLTKKS